ncbi:MAG: phenylalanine--tRNA ligase subunit beta [Candidatus Pelagibacter sp.]|nr:phenylalanine--tRNA ligase subunit beta [Candidatus Pelagibacter sp.]OUV87955.1 MAG: phenylalanine--tRNA ligase subunit beta [Pelagibacteraceae bacterium TMED136]|tara:strand:+ start:9504 stop:11873 length:2370 start_codon:yes stop_codon:yes gene_type:complete
MKLTTSWLKKHLNTKKSVDQIVNTLTNIGLEVEEVLKTNNNLKFFKIAKILKTEKHPNADKLKVCDVDIGGKVEKVVCGASNARNGLFTVYASPGAVIPKNGMKLVVAKIRDVESRGMLCSENELGVSDVSDGIIEIKNKKIGEGFFKNSEEVIDIAITPNRSDCLGIKGIARDLSAFGIGKLIKEKKFKLKEQSKKKIKVGIKKNSGCTTFGSLFIEDIKNCESPKWLKKDLESLGLKSISAVVDITNYVMFDLNRPMHAYDADKIDGNIIVRQSKTHESFEALDEKKYNVPEEACLITDEKKILGLGGIIGGQSSAIDQNTKNIVLEAATFDPVKIAKVSKTLGIITDAKFRFERGVDPNSIESGLKLAAKLIQDICGGKISKINITGDTKYKNKKIKFDINNFKKLIGFSVSSKDVQTILGRLGFKIKVKKHVLDINVPSWRLDVSQEADIIEEILRIKGLDKVSSIPPSSNENKPALNYHQKLFHLVQRSFASRGFFETISWSFTNSKFNQYYSDHSIKLTNPISSDLDVLRSSNFVNLILQAKSNLDRSNLNLQMFEVGPVFKSDLSQETIASGILVGKKVSSTWIDNDKDFSVIDAKEDLFFILSDLGLTLDSLIIEKSDKKYYHPGQSGNVYLGNTKGPKVASFGTIHPLILKKMDIDKSNIYGLEIYLDNFIKPKKLSRVSKKQLKKYDFQIVERDFSFILDKDIRAGDLVSAIKKTNEIIKSVYVFDLYQGENIENDKKSLAIKVHFEPTDKTLNDKEIDDLSDKIILAAKSMGGSLRSQ